MNKRQAKKKRTFDKRAMELKNRIITYCGWFASTDIETWSEIRKGTKEWDEFIYDQRRFEKYWNKTMIRGIGGNSYK